MVGDNNKRKRPSEGRSASGPPSKKPSKGSSSSAGPSSDAKQHSRKIIKAAYKRYNVLCNPALEGQLTAFEGLLDSCEGDSAARRLAARLLPRFAPRFPEKLDKVARALMDLSAWDGSGLTAAQLPISEAARLDALAGLATVCVVAAAKKGDNRTASSIITHLLRRSQQSKVRTKRAVSPTEQACIQQTLADILAGCPRAILDTCLESLGYGSGELFEAAQQTMRGFLAEGGSDQPKRNGATKAPPAPEGGSWMLRAVAGDAKLREWLTSAVQGVKGKIRSAETAALLDSLLAIAAPSPPRPSSKSKTAASTQTPLPKPPPRTTPKKSAPRSRTPPADPRPAKTANGQQEGAKPDSFGARLSEASGEGSSRSRPSPAVPAHLHGQGNGFKRIESGELPDDGGATPSAATPGVERRDPGAGPPAAGPPPLPREGGPLCLAFECLLISGIRFDLVNEAQIRRECEEYGHVRKVVLLAHRSQALIFFGAISHAAACYEALQGEVVLARRALDVQFCQDGPEVTDRGDSQAGTLVWIALPPHQARAESLTRDLLDAGLERPAKTITVKGRGPGVILQFNTAAMAAEALKFLGGWRPLGGSPPRRRSLSPPPRGFGSRRSPPSRRGSPPPRRSPPRGRPVGLPDYASCTLWVGQVGPDVEEKELIDAFRAHGRLLGHKLLRPSQCAFIDFERVEDAATARATLHEAKFASCEIRVEYKEEGRALGRVGNGFGPGFGPGFGARGWGGGRGFAPPFPMRGRGRGRFDARVAFDPRGPRGFRDSPPPPPFRGRGPGRPTGFGDRGYAYSPRHGRSRSPVRSRSPLRRRSPPSPGRSPSRSPVRSRREPRGRFGSLFQPSGGGLPRSREASLDVDRAAPRDPPIPQEQAGGSGRSAVALTPPQPPGNELHVPVAPPTVSSPPAGGSAPPPLPADTPPPAPPQSPFASPPQPPPPLPPISEAPARTIPLELQREGVPQASPSWSGKLAKSGSVVCSIHCLEGPRSDSGGANGLEPLGWPSTLDVTLRIDIKYVLQNVSMNAGAPANMSPVRHLLLASDPSQPECQTKFKDFCEYLTGRGRAGVVQRIPPCGSLQERTMYLIPPSQSIAESLKVAWRPQELMLMAFIVPATLK